MTDTRPTTQMPYSEAERYIRDFLKEESESDDPAAAEDVLTTWEDMCYQEYELLKDMASRHPHVTVDDCEELLHLVTWRFAVRAVNEKKAQELVNQYLAPRLVTYPDGSRSDQVDMEAVKHEFARYVSGLMCDEVILEVFSWSQAAQAAFTSMLKDVVD